jgi:hypothetical protein
LRPELPVLYPAEQMIGWRVSDAAKNSRIEPHAGMTEPIADARDANAARQPMRALVDGRHLQVQGVGATE